jgi:hypothetical protein
LLLFEHAGEPVKVWLLSCSEKALAVNVLPVFTSPCSVTPGLTSWKVPVAPEINPGTWAE